MYYPAGASLLEHKSRRLFVRREEYLARNGLVQDQNTPAPASCPLWAPVGVLRPLSPIFWRVEIMTEAVQMGRSLRKTKACNEITAELRIVFVMAAYWTFGHEAVPFNNTGPSKQRVCWRVILTRTGITGNKDSNSSARQRKQMPDACQQLPVIWKESLVVFLCSFVRSIRSFRILPRANDLDATGKVRPTPSNLILDIGWGSFV